MNWAPLITESVINIQAPKSAPPEQWQLLVARLLPSCGELSFKVKASTIAEKRQTR